MSEDAKIVNPGTFEAWLKRAGRVEMACTVCGVLNPTAYNAREECETWLTDKTRCGLYLYWKFMLTVEMDALARWEQRNTAIKGKQP